MIIKKAEINDSPIIAEIEEKSFDVPWTLQQIKDEICHKNACILIAQTDITTCGYISIRINYDDTEIFRIAVLPEFRHKGIAALLLNEAEKICCDKNKNIVILEVNEMNTAAVLFYKKYGFIEYHRRKNYYKNHAALCMRKELK